jgi:hypothetical protein
MKIVLFKKFLFLCLAISLLATCQSPQTPESQPQIEQPTPTSTITIALQPETEEPITERLGTLEIRFPDPWERPEFCSSEIPYLLSSTDDGYILTGEGKFLCHQIITYEEGMGMKQHLEQEYDVALSGNMPSEPNGILEISLVFEGFQDGYFSHMPENVPEFITVTDPFHVEIDQRLALKFEYQDNAYCLWNENGVFTSLPGDEPPLDQTGWLFLLHPQPKNTNP